ncbi:MAG: efflux transporter periplasmic adaptor subunit [Rhodospirillales bacterium]|nr:efflux transporter periplasmic adaptor subunit [Rhodospirillales bacterium]
MKISILMAAALVLAPVAGQADETSSSVLVATVPAKHGTLPQTLLAYGAVEPAPDGTASISLLRAGQIVKLRVSPGEAVHKGDPLVDFGADPATIATYDQAVSALTAAKQDRSRTADLLSQQLATRAQLTQADKAVADAQSALDALNRAGGGKPVETVRAPFDGIVMSVAVGPGDRLQASAPLMQLAAANQLVVAAGVEPAQRGKLAVGAPVHLDPLDGKGDAIDGTVASVAGMIDPKSRLVETLIRLPADALPGQGYRARIEIGHFTGWLVPREAVLSDESGSHLFQVAGNKAKSVRVTIVGTDGETTVVDGALDSNDPVVTSGSYQLADGTAVRFNETAKTSDRKPADKRS